MPSIPDRGESIENVIGLTAQVGSVKVDHAAVIELTQQLVRIPSVNRPAEGLSEEPAARLVAEVMRGFGWEPIIEEAAPSRPNVIASIEGGLPGPTLLFEGHTDVVTEGDPNDWSFDPFGGVIEDGKLYGRGSADMKGGVAAMLHAVRGVELFGPFPGTIVVAVLCDEEGMMLGVKDFVARGHCAGIDAAIVCEPEAGEVCTSQKGAVRLRIDASGVMAHGAMPQHGKSPIKALAALCLRLDKIEKDLQDTYGEHPHLGWPYLTVTVLQGGSLPQMNVLSAVGVMAVDVRTTPGVDHDSLLAEVGREMQDVEAEFGVELALTVVDDRPATATPEDHPVVQSLVRAHTQVVGVHPEFGGVPGTTDGTILFRDGGVPVVVYGPGGKWIAHQVDEFVDLEDLTRSADVYALAALDFLNQSAAAV